MEPEDDPELNPTMKNMKPNFMASLKEKYPRISPPRANVGPRDSHIKGYMLGLDSECPWCDGELVETEERNMIVVCDKNNRHVIQWQPWGG